MSAVSGARPVRVEQAAAVRCSLRWRVSASAVSLPQARAWLDNLKAEDATLLCEVTETAGGVRADFVLEASNERLALFSGRATVLRQPPLMHVDAFDDSGARLLAATLNADHTLYAVTAAWERLGVAGGRYELQR